MYEHNLTDIQAARLDIADLQARYGARSAADLRAQIERGDLPSHPAWEDAIEWEWLEMYIENIQRFPDTDNTKRYLL